MSAQETVPEEGEVTTSKAASKYVEMVRNPQRCTDLPCDLSLC